MCELKPCPFCGGEAELIWNMVGGFAGCFNDGCTTNPTMTTYCVGDEFKTEAEAESHIIEAWNTRAERTCKVVSITRHDYEGGYAGFEYKTELSCGHTWRDDSGFPPSYCPNCGARVVE